MSAIKNFLYDFKTSYTIDDKIILILFGSIYLHYYISIAVVVSVAIYAIASNDLREVAKSVRKGTILLAFAGYLLLTSLFHANYDGAIVSVLMFLMFVVILYYQKYIHSTLFSNGVHVMIVLSVVNVVYAIIEQIYYMRTVPDMDGFLDIQNLPQFRVHTMFLNANYYAMMILFAVGLCLYQFMKHRDNLRCKLLYILAAGSNLFALFLTGGRVAWACLVLMVLIMLLVSRSYKIFVGFILIFLLGILLLSLNPNLLPRFASQGLAMEGRNDIYQTAIIMVKDMWFFGEGPMTYVNRYSVYYPAYLNQYGILHYPSQDLSILLIQSQHAHSMFLEPFISFGVVGSGLLLTYLGSQLHSVILLIRKKKDFALCSLILGVVCMTLSFCILDFPIYWIQTAMAFLVILGASSIYKKEIKR